LKEKKKHNFSFSFFLARLSAFSFASAKDWTHQVGAGHGCNEDDDTLLKARNKKRKQKRKLFG